MYALPVRMCMNQQEVNLVREAGMLQPPVPVLSSRDRKLGCLLHLPDVADKLVLAQVFPQENFVANDQRPGVFQPLRAGLE